VFFQHKKQCDEANVMKLVKIQILGAGGHNLLSMTVQLSGLLEACEPSIEMLSTGKKWWMNPSVCDGLAC